ncbi:MAG: endo-alpha-N-acetylgalactosaminidase family protein [Planctomycetales bacterium]|nr:endo-alpha-N-acetylgalactosaminidase family protein [Planctomycetales bacterium]
MSKPTVKSVLLTALWSGLVMAANAAGIKPAPLPDGLMTLSSRAMEVTADSRFPRVVSYRHLETGGILYGQSRPLDTVILNGTAYVPQVSCKPVGRAGAQYHLTFPDAGGVTMDARLTVEGTTLIFSIDAIHDTDAFRVNTLEIPQHGLVSVRSSQPDALLASARIEGDKSKCGDTFTPITADTAEMESPETAAYAFASNGTLAAAVATNSIYDHPKGPTKISNGRICYHITKADSIVTAALWSGQWTYRPEKSFDTEPAPCVKVIVTPDRNGDGRADWQDAAIAFRDIMHTPHGADRTPDRVAQHICFNFASFAGNPFLRALDNVKRVYYATDGLGQMVLLKGYQSEGHDSAHSDYGGNIGRRMGGKDDMNTLVNAGGKWNADFGVHLNCTESYPEAKCFSDAFVNPKAPGWGWLDQSYYIHHRQDLCSGFFAERTRQLKQDVPGLAFIYMDVYFGDGWEGLEMARTLQETGFDVTTEFPCEIEHSAIWSHWSVDMTYGPDTSRGINSRIVRFVRNHQKDMFLMHPLLGHAELGDFEGWQSRTDFYDFLYKLYNSSLPAKYLQHFLITRWTDHEIQFTDGVRATDETDRRQFFRDGCLILDGSTYLLPWPPKSEDKLYHWNADGGKTTWLLPKRWKTKTVYLYRLTDNTGRELVARLPVENGQITLDAQPKQPYVIYRSKAAPNRPADWGQGGAAKDPGFNDRTMTAWTTGGDAKAAAIDVDDHGRTALKIAPSAAMATVAQKLTGLAPGVYSASVWVEVEKGRRKASLSIAPDGGTAETVWTDCSFALNYAGNYEWNDTRMQRMQVLFDVPAGRTSALLTLAAEPGESPVRFDNVRVVPTVRTQRAGFDFFEDFENVDEGWYPFVKGDAGGVTDPTTHLSERHSPYTDAGWNEKLINDTLEGSWSLKSHNERIGRVYQTIPQTLRFVPGRRCEVSFDYQSAHDGEYTFIIGAGDKTLDAIPIKETRTTRRFETVIDPGQQTDVWFGIQRNKTDNEKRREVDFVMDNLAVKDLGLTNKPL